MEVIISHNNTDLDGLASMIAAKKLYPEAELVYVGKTQRNVREFMALHRDTFKFVLASEIPAEKITKLILVDNHNPKRIGEIKNCLSNKDLQIHVYDHHPASDSDVKGTVEHIEPIGATTTILVDLLKSKGISISSFEATILAMGIYEDTGCLTYPTTTPKDAEAIAYLLSMGAKLAVVSEFIERPLSDDQKSLLNQLIISSETFTVQGVKIIIGKSTTEEYIDGLAVVLHKVMDLANVEVAIAIVRMEDRIHLVARSKENTLDVGKIAAAYGGGGHETAASATIRDQHLDIVTENIKTLVTANIKPEHVARDLMSSPVKMIQLNKSVDEAEKILLRYGHTGLPVIDKQTLVGIISRRDIAKARRHGLGHAPVKGFMAHTVITIQEETPISEIRALMIDNNIGRLPVVRDGKVVGIVSRTDILRTLHGDAYPGRYGKLSNVNVTPMTCVGDNLKELIENNLPQSIKTILNQINQLAERENTSVYVVGGFVRDLLLGVKNYDIDLVVEGDGIGFAKCLAEFLNGKVKIHEKFSTAMVLLQNGLRIDVVTARTEYYEYPAALPQVEESNLKQDLYRRDFTVNAMAISLSNQNFGLLVDYFGGHRDLDQGLIRVLYNLSFVEDPTRIIRAVRFEQRYDFNMEAQTLLLAKSAIKEGLLQKLSQDRIREEIKHILMEENPVHALLRMDELEILHQILPGATLDQKSKNALIKIPEAWTKVKESHLIDNHKIHIWLVYLAVLLKKQGPLALETLQNLHVTKDEIAIFDSLINHSRAIIEAFQEHRKTSERVELLEKYPVEGYIYLNVLIEDQKMRNHIMDLAYHLRHSKLLVNGHDIKELGYKPGPHFTTAFQFLRAAKIDGEVTTKSEEIDYLKKILSGLVSEGDN